MKKHKTRIVCYNTEDAIDGESTRRWSANTSTKLLRGERERETRRERERAVERETWKWQLARGLGKLKIVIEGMINHFIVSICSVPTNSLKVIN